MDKVYCCETKEPEKLYRIGLFANMNHVTIKALRHYDELGILKPVYVDEASGYRYYASAQIPVIHQILSLRSMGFSLEDIREVQNGYPERELLLKRKQNLLAEIAEKTAKLAQVESYLSSNRRETDYHVRIKPLPEVIVASMRKRIPDYGGLCEFMPFMGHEMEKQDCICAEPEYCFSIYHDGEYREEDIDVEICEAVTEKKRDTEFLKFKVIPAVETAACILHKGPYEGFPHSYAAILDFVEKNGYEICGYPRESYIDGVWNKESEEEWLTEIQFPVQKVTDNTY